jgi:ferredoxin
VSAETTEVVVDRKRCVGSSYCVNIAGGAFAIDPADGKARVNHPVRVTREELEEAVDTCPMSAISLVDEL